TAQAQGELLQHGDLNQQFSDLETQNQVQSDLAALKAQMGKS
ncbi:MAG: phage shock protein PspA, partial [Candidatus Chloroheliales bacterium]